jgi:hypothetical protein
MARMDAGDLAHRLGRQAEAVCRRYLNTGRKHGNYWLVGDANNTPGRSLFVRLHDSAKGPAGKWQDAATGEHGDLLDLIRLARDLTEFVDVAEEARAFLSLPHPEPAPLRHKLPRVASGSVEAAKRLFAISQPIGSSVAGTYLRRRGIAYLPGPASLRFHPRCYYRPETDEMTQTWPAMIAAVTDLDGQITGVHRTWLAPDGKDKAPVDTPRKAMGELLGQAVRFGVPGEVMAAGEGIESVLSVREAARDMAMAAALSAPHLAAIAFPDALRRLYIIRDNDPAGDWARDSLVERANAVGIETIVLSPALGDFNEDLCTHGLDTLRARIRDQFAPQDVARFLSSAA